MLRADRVTSSCNRNFLEHHTTMLLGKKKKKKVDRGRVDRCHSTVNLTVQAVVQAVAPRCEGSKSRKGGTVTGKVEFMLWLWVQVWCWFFNNRVLRLPAIFVFLFSNIYIFWPLFFF